MRRVLLRCLLLTLAVFCATATLAQNSPVIFMTAGNGSAFLPYGEGIAAWLAKKDIHVEIRKSGGSNEKLMAVDASPITIGTAFMASAYEAVNGTGFAAGHRCENLRALFPMYETSFQVAALRKSGLRSLNDLDGKRVGVGPAKGPAEGFFRAAADAAGIKPVIVNGDPAALSRQVLNGEIDALWQGAVVPIPSLVEVANQADAIVFGLSDTEVAAVLAKLPALSPTTIPPGTYKGQPVAIKSFSAWNFVVANKDLPDDVAYAITKAVLSATDPATEIYPTASGTRAIERGQQPRPANPSRRDAVLCRDRCCGYSKASKPAARCDQASRLNSFAAVRPRMPAFSSSSSDEHAKMWSTGASCQG